MSTQLSDAPSAGGSDLSTIRNEVVGRSAQGGKKGTKKSASKWRRLCDFDSVGVLLKAEGTDDRVHQAGRHGTRAVPGPHVTNDIGH